MLRSPAPRRAPARTQSISWDTRLFRPERTRPSSLPDPTILFLQPSRALDPELGFELDVSREEPAD